MANHHSAWLNHHVWWETTPQVWLLQPAWLSVWPWCWHVLSLTKTSSSLLTSARGRRYVAWQRSISQARLWMICVISQVCQGTMEIYRFLLGPRLRTSDDSGSTVELIQAIPWGVPQDFHIWKTQAEYMGELLGRLVRTWCCWMWAWVKSYENPLWMEVLI